MTSAPNTTRFRTDGLTLTIIIRREPGAIEEDGVPNYLELGGIVDTGASEFCLDWRAAYALKLRQIDQVTIQVVGGAVQANKYLADVEIPEIGFRALIPVIASVVGRMSYDSLIGRSVLAGFHVTYHGPDQNFSFVDVRAKHGWTVDDDG
jgi:hypothetical protein